MTPNGFGTSPTTGGAASTGNPCATAKWADFQLFVTWMWRMWRMCREGPPMWRIHPSTAIATGISGASSGYSYTSL